jgi:hypothetical protein
MAGGYSVTFTVVDQATQQIEAINKRITQMRAPMERHARAVQQFISVSGLKQVAEGFGNIARSALGAFESLSRMVPAIGLITSAATLAGMTRLVDTWANFGVSLQRSADRIGTSSQQLQRLQDAARLAGGSADDMTESLKALTDASASAFTGRSPETMAWFNRARIGLTDVNGHLKTSTELLPDVLRYLDGIKNPADRMTAAMGLGGKALFDLDEEFRRSGQTVDQWVAKAKQLTPLSDDQIATLTRYKQAQANVSTALEHLGQQVSVVLAQHFTPLLDKLGEFVSTHTPQIVAAVDLLATKFTDWVEGIDWDQVWKSVQQVGDTLMWVTGHLNEVLKVAEAIAALFALKWAVGMVGSIGQVVSALGAAAPGAAGAATGGSGLLGSLGSVATMASVLSAGSLAFSAWQKAQNPATYAPENLSPNSPFWRGMEDQRPAPAPAGPSFTESPGGWLKNRLGFGGGGAAAGPSKPFSGSQKEFFQNTYNDLYEAAKAKGVAHPEIIAKLGASQASLETGYGQHFVGNNLFGIKAGGGVGSGSVAAMTGEHLGGQDVRLSQNFASFGSTKESAAGYVDFLQRNPRYAKVLAAQSDQEALAQLKQTGYATAPAYTEGVASIQGKYGATLAEGAPAQVTGGAPVSGAVDINITHRNPPPNVTVAATGTGDVNVGTPRTEQQQMSTV